MCARMAMRVPGVITRGIPTTPTPQKPRETKAECQRIQELSYGHYNTSCGMRSEYALRHGATMRR